MSIKRPIDAKHHAELILEDGEISHIAIVKTSNGQHIHETEPIILFRGRDKLALPMLEYYRALCVKDRCTPYQLESIDSMIDRFKQFALTSSTMKQPGITLGK